MLLATCWSAIAAVGLVMANACSGTDATGAADIITVVVTPAAFNVASGDTLRFSAQAFEGEGNPVQATFSWGASGGTVSTTGLFTAGNVARDGRVWATIGMLADTSDGTIITEAPPLDTVFAEGFESGSLYVWDDRGRPENQAIVTTEAHSGTRSLQVTYPEDSDGGWLTKFFMPGYDSLYVGYWVKLQDPWVGPTKLIAFFGSRTDNQWSAIGTAGECPDGTDFFATDVVRSNLGVTRFYAYYPAMPREGDGVTCWGSDGLSSGEGASYAEPTEITPGSWRHIEFWVVLNAPGQSNSVQKLWIDGVLRGTWSGIGLRASRILMLNSVMITASGSGGVTQQMWVDDLLVARTLPQGTE
jgi:hypothetical protein